MKWYEDDSKPVISDTIKSMPLEQLLVEIAKKEEQLNKKKFKKVENRLRADV